MSWPGNTLQLHHEWDAQTRAALESDPPPENDFALAGWQHLRRLTCKVIGAQFAGLSTDLNRAIDRDLLVKIISWTASEVVEEEPPCRIVDKQWDPRSRRLLVSLVEGPSELASALGLDGVAAYLRHCGQTGTWKLTAVEGLTRHPPLILPVFESPGPRLRVSGLAF